MIVNIEVTITGYWHCQCHIGVIIPIVSLALLVTRNIDIRDSDTSGILTLVILFTGMFLVIGFSKFWPWYLTRGLTGNKISES